MIRKRFREALLLLLGLLGFAAIPQAATLNLLPTDRVLILVPHPDDEVLCCGGMIQNAVERHVPIRIVFLTYGDNNAWSFSMYRHFPVFRPKTMLKMGELRRGEAMAADGLLGVPAGELIFLGYPDFGTMTIWHDHWGHSPPYESRMTRVRTVPYRTAYRPGAEYKGEEILKDLQSLIKDSGATKIFIPQPADLQTDHQALYLFAQAALTSLGKNPAPEIYAYLIHAPAWPPHRGLHKELALDPPPSFKDRAHWYSFPLTHGQVNKKFDALRIYRTQWAYSRRAMSSYVRRNELFEESGICAEGAATGAPGCREK